MIKRVSLVRRREGMTQQAFIAHWTGPHADIVRTLPRIRGLRYGVVTAWSPPEDAWDGVGEVWFDSIADAEAAFVAEPWRTRLIADRALFLGQAQAAFVTELTVIEPDLGGI